MLTLQPHLGPFNDAAALKASTCVNCMEKHKTNETFPDLLDAICLLSWLPSTPAVSYVNKL